MAVVETTQFGVFLAAALVLALTPGPGLAYVVARTVAGGRGEGVASSFGTAVGGGVHVLGAGLGLSALIAQSALAFTVVKYAGACYLVYLGVRTLLKGASVAANMAVNATGTRRAFAEGVVVEVLNVKTALFFLAFIPQFVDPAAGHVALQFVVLGSVSVALNTLADVVVAFAASRIREGAAARPALIRRLREASGAAMISLGVGLALAKRPAN